MDVPPVARAVAALAILVVFWRSYVELAARPGVADLLLAVVVGIAVFFAWITFDRGWAVIGGEDPGYVPRDRLDAMLRFMALAAVVPIMEELFWRSFLMRWIRKRDFLALEPRQAGFAAFAISSALFAAEHSFWFAGLLAGAAYAGVYIRSGNIWSPIVAHATTNGILGTWILATGNWRYW